MASLRVGAVFLSAVFLLLLEVASEGLNGYFGTKSRYEDVNPYLVRDPLSLGPAAAGSGLPPSCAPLQLRALLRHGTRYPTAEQIRRLGDLHARLLRRRAAADGGSAAAACPVAADLAAWQMWYNASLDGRLAPQGQRDMEHLARRLAARFPALFAARRRLVLSSSSKHRCLQSGAAFRRGLGPSFSLGGDGKTGRTSVPPSLSEPCSLPGEPRLLLREPPRPPRCQSHVPRPQADGDPAFPL